jgi:hypothetical protein
MVRMGGGRGGLASTEHVPRGSDERNGEIAGSPAGSKVAYVFPLLASSSWRAWLQKETHLPGTYDRTLCSARRAYTRCRVTKQRHR